MEVGKDWGISGWEGKGKADFIVSVRDEDNRENFDIIRKF